MVLIQLTDWILSVSWSTLQHRHRVTKCLSDAKIETEGKEPVT